MVRICLLLVAMFPVSVSSSTQETIKTALSPELDNRLRVTVINYIAKELNVNVEIASIPFARRLEMLKKNQLDLLIGLIETAERKESITYIYPNYTESMNSRFYTLPLEHKKIRNDKDIEGKIIAITRKSKLNTMLNRVKNVRFVEITSLEQCIKMLLRGRIDAFIHNAISTDKVLKAKGLSQQIIKSTYQAFNNRKVYVAIAKKSFLVDRVDDLVTIMEKLNKEKYQELYRTFRAENVSDHKK